MRYHTAALLLLLLSAPGGAQTAPPIDTTVPRLFRSEAPLAITLTANMKQLRDDRSETSPYRPATITYIGADAKPVTVPLKVKTHGIWRLKHCEFPPLRFNFANKQVKGTLFHDLEKPKVVSTCKNTDQHEQLVLREMQLYRIYRTLTPASHRVRTLRISYADSATGKVEATRYGFLFEDPDKVAERLGGKMSKVKGASASDVEPELYSLVFAFEYFISNLDFSFNGLHNGQLVVKPDASPLLPVPYDFDFSGAVNAPYATVDARLGTKKVRERLFRGYCELKDDFPAAFQKLRDRKDAIYALYRDDVGKLLDPGTVRETLEYYDEFYDRIKTDTDAERNVWSTCVGRR
ncbi:MAG: hypothetical protein V4550_04685 [Gemmatimonadota bacterium]